MNSLMNKKPAIAVAIVAGLSLVAAASSVALAADEKAPAARARAALTVTLTSPEKGEWTQSLAANGSVAAWQETVVGAEIAGLRLAEVQVNVGDSVRRGQLLARLSSATVEAELAQSRAAAAEAQAMLASAQGDAERARQLQATGTGALSAQQLQQYLTQEQTARARFEAAQARVRSDELRLAQTRITAVDDGVISARLATVGAVVQPGQELFRLIRQHRLEWRAEVPATELARLKPGMAVQVIGPDDKPVAGKVRMVAPTVDPQTRNALVYVDLPSPGLLRAGGFARGEFQIGRTAALTLPQSAVQLRDGFAYVYKVGTDQKAQQAKVTTGRRVGERIEVLDGLNASAKVVTSGVGFLTDGDLVKVVNDAAPKTASAAGSAGTAAAAVKLK